jgi:SAM-dependent methyltransferase
MEKLNLGCGKDIKKGWINLDSHKTYGADVVFDLEKIFKGKKLPFKDDSFDYIYCSHVLEDFIEPVLIIDEMIRICKTGGKIEIQTPSENSNNMSNIFHKKAFTLHCLIQFPNRISYGQKRNIKVIEAKFIGFPGSNLLSLYSRFGAWFYNFIGRGVVENSFLKYLFPCVNLKVIYEKIQ